MTLRTRIAAAASLSVALAVLAAAVGLYVAVRSDLRGEVDSALRARARAFSAPPPSYADGNGYPGEPLPRGGPPVGGGHPPGESDPGAFPGSVQPAPFGAASGYVQFISRQGAIRVPGGQGRSPTQIKVSARDREIAARGSGSRLTDRNVEGTQLRVLTTGLGAQGAILIARPLTEVDHELGRLLLILVVISAGGIVLAALLGAIVARTALAPIARFALQTETLTGTLDLSSRLDVAGRDELARLAESFNASLDALEQSVQAQRHLIADASHELRTPVSSLKTNIQILGEAQLLPQSEQESLRADLVAELDELTALVGDVVELARDVPGDAMTDDVRLDEIVLAAIRSARRRGDVNFDVSVEPTVVLGAQDRIARAVSNLVDNARKWSPAGGTVEIVLASGVLSVRDHGPGFTEADLPFVFDRFYRAEDARRLPGSGLGLAIVRQAAKACGGFASAENAPGGGALLKVSFGPPLDFSSAA